ncbi:ribosomal protein S5 domain 2-type protein [Crepidotus variabilis]|uniref:Ribosomal RNA-processing protein 43 n=1 Tax=Crepidotus variabilis TaxID=179855 RepID=A0A9P6JPQ2_9AGAR|nr:ribosomal protein S5 domain 2-type protein [Crepidotus variabilis]
MAAPPTAASLSSQSPNLSHLSQEALEELKASVFQRLHPKVYLEKYLDENVRPDGRGASDWRNVEVNVGSISTADGSALVRMGNTTVVCGVKAEIAEPELDREGDGFLVPNLDLPAMCSPRFKPGPPSEEAQVLSNRLNETLVASNFLPVSTLCIQKSKAAWVIYLDATCINYDGNAFDATLLAMVAALRNTTLPQATYNEDLNKTFCLRKAPRVSLQLAASVPLSMSFGIFDSRVVLADPTSFEEPLLESTITVILGDKNKVVTITQVGSAFVIDDGEVGDENDSNSSEGFNKRADSLPVCIQAARLRREELLVVLNKV